ncbi:hydroxyacylglutathione hydrolase [Novosphingobium hassiacum]|uniref:Hydroxyacylglutathione hydrolase n=1 Tax=Novosphingobium hassiacum TaxID=173676 RepID=A0A7W5ZWY8_9SPHN|nr:hydroxyacylglutathione hydrolase [Novosphingobium hassiacum]MBB3860653.1 hydroxyacylglutathione hydrolase [Novosphingobium hassiacum]
MKTAFQSQGGIQIHQFECLSDNYGFLARDEASGEVVCIDTPDADACLGEARRLGWTITQVWNTHWHPDHAGGNYAIKAATDCRIYAPLLELDRIECVDYPVSAGSPLLVGDNLVDIIDVGGHTLGHLAFHIPAAKAVFVGDALFPLGCGRMFEGDPDQFWASLKRLRQLPPESLMYSSHEYTLSNALFAIHVDPDNAELCRYVHDVQTLRERGSWTVPAVLCRELVCNPFLRADDPIISAHWGAGNDVAAFAALRKAKDIF